MATKSVRDRRVTDREHETIPTPAADAATVQRPKTASVRASTVADRIRACAGECASADVRAVVHALLRATRRGAGTTRRASAIEASIAAVLAEAAGADVDRWACLEAAAWALSRLARRRQAAVTAGRLLEQLVEQAHEAAAALTDRDTRPARFVIVLTRLFADVEACRDLGSIAAAAVAEEIGRLVTTDGAVVLSGSAGVVERVCRWTAVRDAMRALDASGWTDDVERRWAAAAAGTLRLLGGETPRRNAPAAMLVAAVAADDRKRARRTARRMQRGNSSGRGRGGSLLPLDLHDAAAATAVVRTGWEPDGVRVLLEYRDAVPRLEIAVGDRPLVDGPWEWGVDADGRPLEAERAWTVSGWESDRKAAFLEIAATLTGGMRLERQLVVLRRQRIVLLADAVVPVDSAAPAELACRSVVPLATRLAVEPAAETREVFVYDDAMRCMALPLALPEWRGSGQGDLAVGDGRLALLQSGARRVYAPLWLDCDPARIGRPLTWRRLTVADTRRNLPPHQAAGFRVQAGLEQWLLYRALDAARNRTLLGCNVSSGFLLGRVRRSGEVARTVEID
jgi:hypothetical protein